MAGGPEDWGTGAPSHRGDPEQAHARTHYHRGREERSERESPACLEKNSVLENSLLHVASHLHQPLCVAILNRLSCLFMSKLNW